MRQAVSSQRTLQRVLPGPALDHLGQGSVALVSGPPGCGKSTYVSHWLAESGQRALWWASTRSLPGAIEARDLTPDVLVLQLNDAGADAARFVQAGRRLWPDTSMIVLSAAGWPSTLRDTDLRVEVAVTGRALCFTAEQTATWALECGAALTERQAEEIVLASGGFAAAVDAVVQCAVENEGYDESALARGCDRGVAGLAAAASAGVIPWAVWEVILTTAHAGQLTVGGLEALWSTAPDGLDALRTMRDAGLVVEPGRAGYLGLAPGLRDACRRRIGTDLSRARRTEIGAALADSFAVTDRLADAVSLLRGADLAAARREFLARHWLRLHELPAGQVRKLLTRVGPNSDPRLLLAQARAIVDVLHRDHPGHVTPFDRASGRTTLDHVRASGERLDDTAQAVLASLRQISDERRRRTESTDVGSGVVALARPGLRIHQGLAALSYGDSEAAAEHFAGGAQAAFSAGLDRLAEIAEYLALLNERASGDPLPRRQAATIRPGPHSEWPQAARLARLIAAVESLDAPVLHEVLTEPGGGPVADEPVIVNVMQIHLECLALVAVGGAPAALAHIEVAGSGVTGHLTAFEQGILLVTRATVLAAAGETAAAWTLLSTNSPDPAAHNDIELLRAQILIAEGEHQEALRRVAEATRRSGGQLGRKSTWAHVLRSVAYRHLGEQEESDHALTVAVMASARSNLLFPFARQGRSELTAVLGQVQRLDLDASSRDQAVRLTAAHDALRSVQRPVSLSEREAVLLNVLLDIDSVRRLGRALHVSPNTIKTQLRSLYRKLEVSSRAEALHVGRLMRLLPATGDGAAPAGH